MVHAEHDLLYNLPHHRRKWVTQALSRVVGWELDARPQQRTGDSECTYLLGVRTYSGRASHAYRVADDARCPPPTRLWEERPDLPCSIHPPALLLLACRWPGGRRTEDEYLCAMWYGALGLFSAFPCRRFGSVRFGCMHERQYRSVFGYPARGYRRCSISELISGVST